MVLVSISDAAPMPLILWKYDAILKEVAKHDLPFMEAFLILIEYILESSF